MSDQQARIEKALSFACDAEYDGEHHKMWVIDQMVRALLGCPAISATANDIRGNPYTYETQGESAAYRQWLADHEDWDEGITP